MKPRNSKRRVNQLTNVFDNPIDKGLCINMPPNIIHELLKCIYECNKNVHWDKNAFKTTDNATARFISNLAHYVLVYPEMAAKITVDDIEIFLNNRAVSEIMTT